MGSSNPVSLTKMRCFEGALRRLDTGIGLEPDGADLHVNNRMVTVATLRRSG